MAEALRSLANLVEDVASRTDTDHVLREICGQYALERCTLAQRDLHYAGVRFMSWSRLLLFAVYRATLRTSDSDAACSLPTSALIAGLSFILTVDESQCIPDELEVDWKTWKSYTFLLGLRLLRGTLADDTYTASPQQLQMLMARLSQSCPSDGDPRDVNDVSWLCHELLHRGHQRAQRIEGPVATARSSRGGHNVGIPDLTSQIAPSDFMHRLVQMLEIQISFTCQITTSTGLIITGASSIGCLIQRLNSLRLSPTTSPLAAMDIYPTLYLDHLARLILQSLSIGEALWLGRL